MPKLNYKIKILKYLDMKKVVLFFNTKISSKYGSCEFECCLYTILLFIDVL